MFKFLKRSARAIKTVAQPATGKRPSSDRAPGWTQPSPLDRLPLPDVQERDDELVWDDWEHSQMELDSRMGPLSVYDTIKVKSASPVEVSDLAPFDAIRSRR
jgi:hypothetical protein